MASQDHSQAPADGSNQPTPANKGGVNPQQQGEHNMTKPQHGSEGHHGGNHGNDANDEGTRAGTAKGSSHDGHNLDAQDRNSEGGGSNQEHHNQTKNTTDSKTEYHDGNAAPSSANDGGKIGDANNPV